MLNLCPIPIQNPSHWSVVKRILYYLQYTRSTGLTYSFSNNLWLQSYIKANWGSDANTQKFTSGYVFLLGGEAIFWQCCKQMTVVLSSTRSKYIAVTLATKEVEEAVWLKQLLQDLAPTPIAMPQPILLHCNNQSYILLTKNPHFHNHTKHIELHYHFLHEKIKSQEIVIKYCPTNDMWVDLLTKALPQPKHVKCCSTLGLIESLVINPQVVVARGGVFNDQTIG